MNISAAELKHVLKKLGPVKTDSYQISSTGVSAQDSDALVIVECPFSGLEGTVNISGKKFTQIVNRMGGQISLEFTEKFLSLKSAKAKVDLEIQPVKPVPVPKLSEYSVSLALDQFKKATALSAASASSAKAAAFGNVVLFQNLPIGLEETISPGYRITGTDSVVLTTVTVESEIPLQFRVLINLTGVALVQLMEGETISVGDSDKFVILKSGNMTVYASKPYQQYPDFDKLLAKVPGVRISLKPEEWLAALRTIEPLIDETIDKGAIDLHFVDGVVKCSSIGVGSRASDEAPYEQLEPDPIFDPKEFDLKIVGKYLAGFLSRCGEEATLGTTDSVVRLESGNVVVLTAPIGNKK